MPIIFGETQPASRHGQPMDTWKCDFKPHNSWDHCEKQEESPDGVTPDDWVEDADGEVFCEAHAFMAEDPQ